MILSEASRRMPSMPLYPGNIFWDAPSKTREKPGKSRPFYKLSRILHRILERLRFLSTARPEIIVPSETGAGFFEDEIHHERGCRQKGNKSKDSSLHFRYDGPTFLYFVFHGQKGKTAAYPAWLRQAVEPLLGNLRSKITDEDVEEILRKTSVAIERGYVDSIVDIVAKQANLHFDISDGLNCYEIREKFRQLANEVFDSNYKSSVGSSVVVALIHTKRLFVANFRSSDALLSKTDSDHILSAIILKVDHNLMDEDELFRKHLHQLYMENMELTKVWFGPFSYRSYPREDREYIRQKREILEDYVFQYFSGIRIPGFHKNFDLETEGYRVSVFMDFEMVREKMTKVWRQRDLNDIIRQLNKFAPKNPRGAPEAHIINYTDVPRWTQEKKVPWTRKMKGFIPDSLAKIVRKFRSTLNFTGMP